MAGRVRESERARFERFTSRGQPTECWPWRGYVMKNGYGRFGRTPPIVGLEVVKVLAHRMAWMFANGDIPDATMVLHRCDNRCCVNPAHLFLGSAADNTSDMIAKGRHSHGARHFARRHPDRFVENVTSGISKRSGSNHYAAKLTEAAVVRIRELHAGGHSLRSIARQFGVTDANIAAVVSRRTWRHVA